MTGTSSSSGRCSSSSRSCALLSPARRFGRSAALTWSVTATLPFDMLGPQPDGPVSPSRRAPTLSRMSSISLYEQEVARQRRRVESGGKKEADESRKAADADKRAADYEKDAARSSSAGTASSKLRQAQHKRDEATKHRARAAKAAADKARAEGALHAAQRRLEDARAKESKKQRDARSAIESGSRLSVPSKTGVPNASSASGRLSVTTS